jgi:ribosomal-protein-alanine N-acetyltransferase
VQRLEAEVMTVNVASNRVMEKCGFTCEGTKRQAKFVNIYTDFNIYGLLRSDIMGERAAST